jgi:PKD repeat protein
MTHKFFQRFASLFLALALSLAGFSTALAAAPGNDFFINSQLITTLPFSSPVDITEATSEPNEPAYCAVLSKSVWYSFTATDTMLMNAYIQENIGSSIMTIYQSDGGGIDSLSFRTCVGNNIPYTFLASAGQTYYLQVGTYGGSDGTIQVNMEQLPPPANDNFADAANIDSLPFSTPFDFSAATLESGEPVATTCPFALSPHSTLWYVFQPAQDGPLTALLPGASGSPFMAVYSGTNFNDLSELECVAAGGAVNFQGQASQTYYIQIGSFFEQMGNGSFTLEVTPLPVAAFFYSPQEPSIYNEVQFFNYSNDPAGMGIQALNWDFGDGTTVNNNFSPTHRYAADGSYQVTLTVSTPDNRTASTSQVIQVRTHDISISSISAPKSANVGQTKAITVALRNIRYPETVRLELYRSVAGGGFTWVSSSTQFVPVRSGNRTTQFTFNYTFHPEDAQVGKVTFRVEAVIEGANDAFAADNQAFSTPPTKVSR